MSEEKSFDTPTQGKIQSAGNQKRDPQRLYAKKLMEKKKNKNLISPLWLPPQIKTIDHDFVQWFIGFSEGDGSWILASYKNKDGSEAIYQRHFFRITQKEPHILQKIRTRLGFGSVKKYNDKKGSTYRFIVSDLAGTVRLIHIFNGNLVLEKTQRSFESWLKGYNLRPTNEPIQALNCLRCKIALNNAWLSGFIDADGCFSVMYRSDDILALRFILDQKKELEALRAVQQLFDFGSITPRKELDMHRYTLTAAKKIKPKMGKVTKLKPIVASSFCKLFKYLERYSLKKKNIDYTRFKKIWVRLNDAIRQGTSRKACARLERLIQSLKDK